MFSFLAGCSLALKEWVMFVSYVKNNAFPQPLSSAEESRYVKQMEEGDDSAQKKLIEHNMRLVAHIAKKFDKSGEENEDLISIGMIGLIKAIKSYNSTKGAKLATYAARCIENEILMYFRSKKKTRNDVSLHDPIGSDKEGNELSLLDVMGTEPDEIHETVESKLDSVLVRNSLRFLDEKEQKVIIWRYGLDGGAEKTQCQIGKKLGISRSYVSRIEGRALKKLLQRLNQKPK